MEWYTCWGINNKKSRLDSNNRFFFLFFLVMVPILLWLCYDLIRIESGVLSQGSNQNSILVVKKEISGPLDFALPFCGQTRLQLVKVAFVKIYIYTHIWLTMQWCMSICGIYVVSVAKKFILDLVLLKPLLGNSSLLLL